MYACLLAGWCLVGRIKSLQCRDPWPQDLCVRAQAGGQVFGNTPHRTFWPDSLEKISSPGAIRIVHLFIHLWVYKQSDIEILKNIGLIIWKFCPFTQVFDCRIQTSSFGYFPVKSRFQWNQSNPEYHHLCASGAQNWVHFSHNHHKRSISVFTVKVQINEQQIAYKTCSNHCLPPYFFLSIFFGGAHIYWIADNMNKDRKGCMTFSWCENEPWLLQCSSSIQSHFCHVHTVTAD